MLRFFGVAASAMLLTSPAWSKVRIDVGCDEIMTEVQPENKRFFGRGESSIILNSDGTVTKNLTGGISTNTMSGYASSIDKAGIGAVVHYKIANGSIVEYYENQYIRQVTTIRTNGQNICDATMVARAPRGQEYMIWSNPTRYVSRLRPINITCRIQKLN